MKRFIWFLLIVLIVVRVATTKQDYKNGQHIRLSATATTDSINYGSKQRVNLGGLKFYLPAYPEIRYGDQIVIEGIVNGGELENAKLIQHKDTSNFLLNFKRDLINFWRQTLPEPHSALVAGIVLGSKSSLPQSFWEILKKTGTTHVVVASGMNVTFTASFLVAVLIIFLERRRAVFVAILGIILYCFVTGFEAPIVRAAIMGSFVFLAQGFGRVGQTLRLAFLSGLVMLIIKPSWLTDLGFILSFCSTISLILFEKKVSTKLQFVPSIFRESLSTSLAAQAGVAPVLFIAFGQINLLSPVVNVLVLWVVPLIMVISSIGGVVGLLIPGLGKLILYLVYPLTSWFIWITQTFANFWQ